MTTAPSSTSTSTSTTLGDSDVPVHGGRTLAYVYDSGLPEVDARAAQAVARFAGTNGLDPTAFPSLLQMENELVGFAADLIDAPPGVVGTVTSGGTESIALAVLAARDARPDVARPTMVLPDTAHPSFLRAASLLGVEPVVVPTDAGYRAHVGPMASAMDERTVLAVVSAPSYAHGVVDPVAWIGSAALAKGVPLHVDACVGGWLLAYGERLGRYVSPWTFNAPGVSSISMDLHKYGYTPKGASILLFRDAAARRATYFTSAAWPGATMVNTTLQSTRPGGPVAGAWTTVHEIGHDGYLRLAAECLDAVDHLVAGLASVPGLRLVCQPDSALVVLRPEEGADVWTVAEEMRARGWYVGPQPSWRGEPPTLHLSISAGTRPHVEECLQALRESVAQARARGPVRLPARVREMLSRLEHQRLDDATLYALVQAAGIDLDEVLAGSDALLGAVVDAAPPAVREVLLGAFADLLYTPTRS